MNVVIIGAGQTGTYLAGLLSQEKHSVILIDKDPKKLEEASWNSDIKVQEGSGTDWQLLDYLLELSPDLFVAVTSDDATNLTASAIAKNLGYPRTISRVRDNRYLNRTRLDFGRIFDVDDFIGPELLVANEIYKYLISPAAVRVETFAHGAVQMRTVAIPTHWRQSSIPLSQLNIPSGIMVGLIRRKINNQDEVIFPHGTDVILPEDELTIIGEAEKIEEAHLYFGTEKKVVNSIVMVGGSRTAINLAKVLEPRKTSVRIIEKDYEKCTQLTQQLPKTTILNSDGTNYEFLLSEKVGLADAFVSCTGSDEVNILTSLLAQEAGCTNVISLLSNSSYIPLIARLGIEHASSPRVLAANKILALTLSERVTSLVSLYENRAEVMEVHVSMKSRIAGIPLSELGPLLPSDFLIGVIQNRGRIMIANGNHIISPGDAVIVITNPKHRSEIKKIF